MLQYSIEYLRFNAIERLCGKVVFLLILLSGLLPWIAERVAHLPFVLGGLVFIALPSLVSAFAALPFGYYRVFVIEEKYGFNTRTFKLWLLDLAKTSVLSILLGAILISALLLMIEHLDVWWFWAWLVFFLFQLLVLFVYPTLLAPLFNKFSPLPPGPLREKIERLSVREGLSLKDIYEMDAAKRSRHTNAYVSGLGRTKRIVLFDTLQKSHDDEEILAILAHEIGHLKLGHLKKQIFLMGAASLVLFFVAFRVMSLDVLYSTFGFQEKIPYAGLLLIGALWEPLGFWIAPIGAALSRKFEKQADLHAVGVMKDAGPFIRALKKMSLDNLSNLHPHPLYVYFHYSHPPILQRIQSLAEVSRKRSGGGDSSAY
jgi:STE24 endopeptidase